MARAYRKISSTMDKPTRTFSAVSVRRCRRSSFIRKNRPENSEATMASSSSAVDASGVM